MIDSVLRSRQEHAFRFSSSLMLRHHLDYMTRSLVSKEYHIHPCCLYVACIILSDSQGSSQSDGSGNRGKIEWFSNVPKIYVHEKNKQSSNKLLKEQDVLKRKLQKLKIILFLSSIVTFDCWHNTKYPVTGTSFFCWFLL